MTCNITNTPHLTDTLPLYTARQSRDSDTTSIRSAAPSYTSAAPSYHSSMPAPPRARTNGLPNPPTAPGFTPALPRLGGSSNSSHNLSAQHYNIPSWSSPASSHQARSYQNVAKRRASATLASVEAERAALAFAAVMSSITGSRAQQQPPPADSRADLLEEDPYLVGGEAAARAKRERLQKMRQGEEVLRQEDEAWDFMVKQMADWEKRERERSWKTFPREKERPGGAQMTVGGREEG